jgi:hypothetical protein
MKQFSLLMLCIVLHSCIKSPDCTPNTPSCQIAQIKQTSSPVDSLTFVYNSKGNPLSITRTQVGTSQPNFKFLYDHKNRLTDFYGVYDSPNPYFDVWHRYHYDAKNRIISDTTFEFGLVGNGVPLPDQTNNGQLRVRNVSTYAYDQKDRIIKSTDTYGHDFLTIRTYTYNHEGNIANLSVQSQFDPGTTTYSYDDKINPRRTNAIWQFLDRDYSMNNSVEVAAYNIYGLPTVINVGSHGYGQFAIIPLGDVEIRYTCR